MKFRKNANGTWSARYIRMIILNPILRKVLFFMERPWQLAAVTTMGKDGPEEVTSFRFIRIERIRNSVETQE